MFNLFEETSPALHRVSIHTWAQQVLKVAMKDPLDNDCRSNDLAQEENRNHHTRRQDFPEYCVQTAGNGWPSGYQPAASYHQ